MDYIKKSVKEKISRNIPDKVKKMLKLKVFDKYYIKNEKEDPTVEEVCGNIWYNGSEEQREIFGDGTEGKGTDEQPPDTWWEDCIGQKSQELEDQE